MHCRLKGMKRFYAKTKKPAAPGGVLGICRTVDIFHLSRAAVRATFLYLPGPGGGMADAEDLKSSGDFSSCGFDSHPGHQSPPMAVYTVLFTSPANSEFYTSNQNREHLCAPSCHSAQSGRRFRARRDSSLCRHPALIRPLRKLTG